MAVPLAVVGVWGALMVAGVMGQVVLLVRARQRQQEAARALAQLRAYEAALRTRHGAGIEVDHIAGGANRSPSTN